MYTVFKRKQFNFEVTDEELSCLLTSNVQVGKISVNIVGMFTQKISNTDKNYVKIVVGQADPANETLDNPSTDCQTKQFKKNLDKLNIKYKTKKIIEIYNEAAISGNPGVVRIDISALTCKNIPIISYYFGEFVMVNNVTAIIRFIDVPEDMLDKAIKIFNKFKLSRDENELCINRFNVNKC